MSLRRQGYRDRILEDRLISPQYKIFDIGPKRTYLKKMLIAENEASPNILSYCWLCILIGEKIDLSSIVLYLYPWFLSGRYLCVVWVLY